MGRAIAFALAGSPEVLDLNVYDVVGEAYDWDGNAVGTSARQVLDSLRAFTGSTISVRINSIGGDAFDGLAIYNLLRDRSKKGCRIEVDIDALAASAASVIACAGDVIRMPENAAMMIHRGVSRAAGGVDEMERAAEMLRKLNSQIAVTYHETAQRFGRSTTPQQIEAAMKKETWLLASEAVEFGLASEVTAATEVAAQAMSVLAEHHRSRDPRWHASGFEKGAGQFLVEAQHTTNPAQSGPTQKEESNTMSIKLIEALGAKDENDALEIVAQATALATGAQVAVGIVTQLEETTGQSASAAMAVVQAWRASHEQLAAAQAEAETLRAEIAKRDAYASAQAVQSRIDALVAAGLESTKLTAATEAWARTQTPESLEAYLAVAHPALPHHVAEPARTGASGLTHDEIQAAAIAGLTTDEFARAKAARLQVAVGDEE